MKFNYLALLIKNNNYDFVKLKSAMAAVLVID